MKVKNLVLVNDQSQLETLAEFLENAASEWEIPLKDTMNLNLVLEELFTNIVFYGYTDQLPHEILIQMCLDQDQITVSLEDDGREFNPLTVPEPDRAGQIEDRKIGGLGIFFVRNFTDDVTYQRLNNKNILTLKKIIKKI